MNIITGAPRIPSSGVMKWTLTSPDAVLENIAEAGTLELWPAAEGVTIPANALRVGHVFEVGVTIAVTAVDTASVFLFAGRVSNDGNYVDVMAITEDDGIEDGWTVACVFYMTVMDDSTLRVTGTMTYYNEGEADGFTRLFYPGIDDGEVIDYPIDLTKESSLAWSGGFTVIGEENNSAQMLSGYLKMHEPAPIVEE